MSLQEPTENLNGPIIQPKPNNDIYNLSLKLPCDCINYEEQEEKEIQENNIRNSSFNYDSLNIEIPYPSYANKNNGIQYPRYANKNNNNVNVLISNEKLFPSYGSNEYFNDIYIDDSDETINKNLMEQQFIDSYNNNEQYYEDLIDRYYEELSHKQSRQSRELLCRYYEEKLHEQTTRSKDVLHIEQEYKYGLLTKNDENHNDLQCPPGFKPKHLHNDLQCPPGFKPKNTQPESAKQYCIIL